MRLRYITTLAAVTALTLAKPHRYAHRHANAAAKRNALPDNVVYVPAATVTKYVFQLDGQVISEEEVRQGIANGTLQWGEDSDLFTFVHTPIAIATPPPTSMPQIQGVEVVTKPQPQPTGSTPEAPPSEKPSSDSAPKPPSQPSSLPQPSSSPSGLPVSSPDVLSQTPAFLVDKDGHCASCDKEFPNNELPCNEFPHGYGALPLTNEGLGGWSGIQDPQYREGDGFDDITTIPKGSCSDGSCCRPGTYCSYGCPNPYLKLSFPSMQGRTGQSVGGLYCNNDGFLEMADGSLGKTLCGPGSEKMKVKVQNKLKKSVSICRTDYPGTESMTFPLTIGPGQTMFLANPDQGKYFRWKNLVTSAHYYVNKQGVPESEACTWGEENGGMGNWAPAIFGTSFDGQHEPQLGYSSLKQNSLCKSQRLDYSITFTGEGLQSACAYNQATDQYCEGNKCWTDKDTGCTSATPSGGTLTIVLSDEI